MMTERMKQLKLNRTVPILFACGLALLADIVFAEQPEGKYLDGGRSKVGVVLVHGRFGGHGDATSPVVNPLRIAIHKHLGFHTLSINYPQRSRSKSAADEVGDFPAAYTRIDSAISFLTKEKGVTQIYVMGHSLGTRITTSYLANHTVPELRGYVGVGIYGGGPCDQGDANPLNSRCSLKTILEKNPTLPIVDVVAMGDETDVRFANGRTQLVSPMYRQVRVEGADHRFIRKEDEMVNIVIDWLREQTNK